MRRVKDSDKKYRKKENEFAENLNEKADWQREEKSKINSEIKKKTFTTGIGRWATGTTKYKKGKKKF